MQTKKVVGLINETLQRTHYRIPVEESRGYCISDI
jgi:hypothetical protein